MIRSECGAPIEGIPACHHELGTESPCQERLPLSHADLLDVGAAAQREWDKRSVGVCVVAVSTMGSDHAFGQVMNALA